MTKNSWKKGRGKLGFLEPLIGIWIAEDDSPMGKYKCTRKFKKTLDGAYVQLDAIWEFSNKTYVETAIFGLKNNQITFWSFTSDGKNSEGILADGSDIHPEAICFVAQMPAGLARMIYWPREDGFNWAVESKNKNGWNRFTEHYYTRSTY
ncbi:MAG TPA: hypothetical protein VLB74_05690 [Flavobacterium sp.]|uniref:hypothetical protein n=1 Tax=Flavobacterium sp. TaxID=239 RepID=UPI002C3D91EE|nr:hypothetical protein [Flavobacterium sp.]HSD14118.1 hypothetical protein [Flavobacterium sp.]